ncbi:hypothetical protein PLICRDRAFT_36959 [Plicaturopsis crispa FD-325 SS-3]|nr:hypothetical protein PLICRDRAFT_36959 [Plicaturopsis crispa FD-325 SS-3]
MPLSGPSLRTTKNVVEAPSGRPPLMIASSSTAVQRSHHVPTAVPPSHPVPPRHPDHPSRFVHHVDVMDISPQPASVVDLPPHYIDRRA